MPYDRDPASVLLDSAARRLLMRAYARPGQWVGTRLAVPTRRTERYLAALGIQWAMPDRPSVRGGRGLNARTRWGRAFVRAIYFQHNWYSGGGQSGFRAERRREERHSGAIKVEVGRAIGAGQGRPSGRAVRIKFFPRGGQAAANAAARLPDADRIFTDAGEQTARSSDPALRDW